MNVLDRLIAGRKFHFTFIAACTFFFSFSVAFLETDERVESLVDTSAPDYRLYQTYLERFGPDHLVIAAVSPRGRQEAWSLESLGRAAQSLRGLPAVMDVNTLLDAASIQRSAQGATRRSVVVLENGAPRVDTALLSLLRKTLPAIRQLISQDHQTYGILIRLHTLDHQQHSLSRVLGQIRACIAQAFEHADIELHMTGIPVFVEAITRYNIKNALSFVAFASAVGLLIEAYLFKNMIVSLIALAISAAAALWGAGLMALSGMKLNPVSGMAFGMILILTTTTVIHLISHYYDHFLESGHRQSALRKALGTVARPSFYCAATTAVGFFSIVVSSVPTIRQFGLIMAVGAVLSFVLVFLVLPFVLLHSERATPQTLAARSRDLLARLHARLGEALAAHPKRYFWISALMLLLFACGTPLIRIETQMAGLFHPGSPEMTAYRFVTGRLSQADAVHVVIAPDPGKPWNVQSLRAVKALEEGLLGLPEVQGSHSFFRVLETAYASLWGKSGPEGLYESAFMLQAMYQRLLSDPNARQLLRGCIDEKSRSLCITLHMRNVSHRELTAFLARIRRMADDAAGALGSIWVTGAMVVAHTQSQHLIDAQVRSLALALLVIAALLMLQSRSWRMGALSLIPNFYSLIALFGIMGWLGIPLDNITVMVAAIALGLAVDDTIHYLSQLKQNLRRHPVDTALRRAYQVCGKALISTSAVLFFCFLTLMFSPFKPTASFGLLASIAVAMALIGDLVFLPALLLSFPLLRRLVEIPAGPKAQCREEAGTQPLALEDPSRRR